MLRDADEHRRRRGPADLSASHHQAEVLRLYVVATGLQAMIHRFIETRSGTGSAKVYASLHIG
jgi:hypothetical protein